MKLKATDGLLPTHDYNLALRHALSWLGDRYLLAAPISARPWLGRMRHVRPPLYAVEPRISPQGLPHNYEPMVRRAQQRSKP